MNLLNRCVPALVAFALVSGVLSPQEAHAKTKLLRLWGQTHATYLNGPGPNFREVPNFGYGAQVGVAALIFEVYLDINMFQLGKKENHFQPSMWNEVGIGLNAPLPSPHPNFGWALRGDFARAFAPVAAQTKAENVSPWHFRGGLQVDGKPTKFLAIGLGTYGGYHIASSNKEDPRNGFDFMMQLYTRFEFGF